ncbi:DUF4123 domain-containing protein [Burkholderia sp. BCC1988]|uniref:DUF4123 domain-containing protein n=1 Tax=Burkholderia sp. BCC1988 TaxID=2817443 RepID=UPI002AB14480|nr:DUF4123 domain-containing protein [Burkholderia sp. BCC1988]
MMSNATRARARLLCLIDAGASPALIYPLLEKSGADFRSVYSGLPEEELGPASLFLAPITDTEADWVVELDRIDRQSPCLSLVWSRVEPQTLVAHLQAFLFADIGDGMTAMVRYFDPRITDAVFKVWGDQIGGIFMGPIERWMYRGRHEHWQRIENDSLTGARICRSIRIELEQSDVDALCAHTEPDELLASLVETGLADLGGSYLERFNDFLPRYQRAVQWGFSEPADRFAFCHHSYLYGSDFDHHRCIYDALAGREKGKSFGSVMDTVPRHVWDELKRKRDVETDAAL